MSGQWTYPDVWTAVAETVPDRPIFTQAGRTVSWREARQRALHLAGHLRQAGLAAPDKVALYLHNGPEYLEATFGVLRARLAPVNTNYRYVGDELLYLWENADAACVIFHGTFTATVEAIRGRCRGVRLWLHVDDGSEPCPAWATPYGEAVAAPSRALLPEPSGDDLILIYTGGTTGLPRGVMWRQHDLYLASNTTGDPVEADLDHVRARVAAPSSPAPVGLSAAPLMHGTGFVFATTILNRAGTLVTLPGTQFDPARLLDAMAEARVTDLCIVGDAFCLPIVEQLEQHHGRWDLSALKVVSSSGMAWSAEAKERLLAHAPGALLIDFLNASEASGIGRSLTSKRTASTKGGRFKLGENAFVIREDGSRVEPGSGEVGRLAVRGHVPLGYYKDEAKTAATFPTVDGMRCAVPGDYATVEADGAISLLGRGSVSINTGGEKVFPEEVEGAIRTYPQVRDAVVVGLPDRRFGETVGAVVETVGGAAIDPTALIEHVRAKVARYKAPRHVMTVATIGRGPNGKADYPGLRGRMVAWLDAGGRS